MSHEKFLQESDELLRWISSKGFIKTSREEMAAFCRRFNNSLHELNTHLHRRGHIETFYGGRIRATQYGQDFIKRSSYLAELPETKRWTIDSLFIIAEVIS